MSFPSTSTTKSMSEKREMEETIKAEKHLEGISEDNKIKQLQISVVERAFKELQAAKDCKSLLKKHLSKQVVDQLKDKKTKFDATLMNVIQSGVAHPDSGIGVYAPDAEAYTLFKSLFDPIIQEYHNGFSPSQSQPATDFGEKKSFPNLDPEGKYINSTRISCSRNLQGYPFSPCLSEANYTEMEQKVKGVFNQLKGEWAGTYYSLNGMTQEIQTQLIQDHFLFEEGDRFLQAADACRYWPTGRGIFHNPNKTFLVWVNQEDHLRISSMQKKGNVGKVLDRLVRGVKAIEKGVPCARDPRLGYLTFCPTNLGSTVRASVHIKLPKVAALKDFKEICDKMSLQVRDIDGEHSDSEGGVVMDISNKQRLGISEYQAVRQMYDGVKELIKMEKKAA